MEKNKSRWRVWLPWVFTLAVIAVLCLPFAAWFRQEARPLEIWVLDKTVSHTNYREHAGLFWILNYARIDNPETGGHYQPGADYYGFYPEDDGAYTVEDLPGGEHFPALIYVADTYGVYREDYKEAVRGDRSPTIYGGLTEKDVHAIGSNLKDNTLIAEFNCLAYPTDSKTREQFQNLLGLQWEGWTGCYFDKLDRDEEVAPWMISSYEKQYSQSWDFTGPGVIITSESQQIVVLPWKEDFGPEGIKFVMEPQYAEEFGITRPVPYYNYFEFVTPALGTQVLASFQLDLTESGQARMEAAGLSGRLPAVVRRQEAYTSYYFAGDFAENLEVPSLYQYKGWPLLRKTFSIEIAGDQQAFFWRAYVPMMLKIIDDVKIQQAP